MTRPTYRLLLSVYLATFPFQLLAALGYLGGTHSPLLTAAYESEPGRVGHTSVFFDLLVLAVLLLACVGAIIGLFRFRHWGRVLGLWTSVLSLPWMVWMGAYLQTGLEAALSDLQTMLWGGLLALAWFGPVSTEFARGRTPPAVKEPASPTV